MPIWKVWKNKEWPLFYWNVYSKYLIDYIIFWDSQSTDLYFMLQKFYVNANIPVVFKRNYLLVTIIKDHTENLYKSGEKW